MKEFTVWFACDFECLWNFADFKKGFDGTWIEYSDTLPIRSTCRRCLANLRPSEVHLYTDNFEDYTAVSWDDFQEQYFPSKDLRWKSTGPHNY